MTRDALISLVKVVMQFVSFDGKERMEGGENQGDCKRESGIDCWEKVESGHEAEEGEERERLEKVNVRTYIV